MMHATPTGRLLLNSDGAPVPLPTGGLYNATTITGWSTQADSIGAANNRSPDFNNTSAAFIEDTTNNDHLVRNTVAQALTATNYTLSVYAKQIAGNRNLYLDFFSDAFGAGGGASFDLSMGVLGTDYFTYGGFVMLDRVATRYPNGWWKCSVRMTAIISTQVILQMLLVPAGATSPYLGNGVASNAVWGIDFRAS